MRSPWSHTSAFHWTLGLENQLVFLFAASKLPWEDPSAREPQQGWGPPFWAGVLIRLSCHPNPQLGWLLKYKALLFTCGRAWLHLKHSTGLELEMHWYFLVERHILYRDPLQGFAVYASIQQSFSHIPILTVLSTVISYTTINQCRSPMGLSMRVVWGFKSSWFLSPPPEWGGDRDGAQSQFEERNSTLFFSQ